MAYNVHGSPKRVAKRIEKALVRRRRKTIPLWIDRNELQPKTVYDDYNKQGAGTRKFGVLRDDVNICHSHSFILKSLFTFDERMKRKIMADIR